MVCLMVIGLGAWVAVMAVRGLPAVAIYPIGVVAGLIMLAGLVPLTVALLRVATYTWDDVGLERRATAGGWRLAWSDLVDCAVQPGRAGAPVFELALRDGFARTIDLDDVPTRHGELFAELMRRTAKLRGQHEAALDGRELEITRPVHVQRDMRSLAVICGLLALLGLVLGAVGLVGWQRGASGQDYAGMASVGGCLVLMGLVVIPVLRAPVYRLDDEGITRVYWRRSQALPWPAIEQVTLKSLVQNGTSTPALVVAGGGRRWLISGGGTLWLAAERRVLARASSAEISVSPSRSANPWWAALAAPMAGADGPVAVSSTEAPRGVWRVIGLAAAYVCLVSFQVAVRTQPDVARDTKRLARRQQALVNGPVTEATVTEPCGLTTDHPHVHYRFLATGRQHTGRLDTPGRTWREHPAGSKVSVRYVAADPDDNWPESQPPKLASPGRTQRSRQFVQVAWAVCGVSVVLFLAALPHLRQRDMLVRQAGSGPAA